MKVKLLITLLFIYSQSIFCQSIKGKVISNNYALSRVEVINSTQKTTAVSDTNGDFSIVAKSTDILVFVSKEHDIKKVKVPPQNGKNSALVVELALKAEELKEVFVNNQPSVKLGSDTKWEQGKVDQYTLDKNAQRLKVVGVSTHTIENGMDFMKIGKLIGSLFKKEKDSTQISKNKTTENFKTIAKHSFEQGFFVETLKLKPDQVDLFLQFCEKDPKSNTLLQDSNELAILEFLLNKNKEFKKL